MNSEQEFAVWLRARRKNQGLSQTQLAKMVGIDRTTLAKIELDRHRITLNLAVDLAEALNKHWDSLVMSPPPLERLARFVA